MISSRPLRALRSHLTPATGMAAIALFVSLGGGAYAVTAVPSGSVGTEQIKPRAVTTSRIAPGAVTTARLANGAVETTQIAPGSVTLNRLSEGVQRRILATRTGPAGPVGPAGPAGPGAGRLAFHRDASADPSPEVVLDIAGLRMRATCVDTTPGTAVVLTMAPDEDVTFTETVTVDHGADLAQGGQTDFTGNLAIAVPGGVETTLGGPSATAGFARVVATLVMPFSARTVSAQIAITVDADAGRCTVDGTAVTASA